MSTEKEKSFWDLKATTSFIIACLEQVIGIVSKFKELIGKFYDKSEFKNKFGNLRRKWLVWYRLLGKETGLRWDNVKNIVDAIDEWWKRKQLESLRFVFSEKPLYGKFWNKGLSFAHKLTILFKDVVANGYQKGVGIDIEEGSGDSEDASIGKKKLIALSQVAEVVSVIAKTCKSHTKDVASAFINEVVKELKVMPEVANDVDFHTNYFNFMLIKTTREMFIALQGEDVKRLHWLKYAGKT
ncbi:hypothetical protein AAZX31_04G149600 [Glycine max]